MPDPSAIRQRLEEALDRWEQSARISLPPSKAADRELLINNLTLMTIYEPGGVKRAFRTPNRETTQKELTDIADRAGALAIKLRDPKRSVTRARQQLATHIEDMHGTTIDALAAAPGGLDVGVIRRELPHLLCDDSADRGQLANVLDLLARVAATAVALAPDTEDEGRWPDRRAQIVASFLARYCRDVTGHPPTIATHADSGEHYGAFLDLAAAVFTAMGIDHKPFSYAYAAANQLRRMS